SARASTREPTIPATSSGTSIPDVASATRAGHGCGWSSGCTPGQMPSGYDSSHPNPNSSTGTATKAITARPVAPNVKASRWTTINPTRPSSASNAIGTLIAAGQTTVTDPKTAKKLESDDAVSVERSVSASAPVTSNACSPLCCSDRRSIY